MAQKKIALELSNTEVQHLMTALEGEQADHERRLGRRNPALSRVQTKVAKAQAVDGDSESETTGEDESTDEE